MKLNGYTVQSGGLILGWRRTASKAFDLADTYVNQDVQVLFGQHTLEEIEAIERCEQSRLRSPIALQIESGTWMVGAVTSGQAK